MTNLKELFKILNIKPNHQELYVQALTHKTFTNENKNSISYEKLEFLGDSILQFKSTLFIYQQFKNVDEGIMSNIRAKNVSSKALSEIIKHYKINDFLICSNNKEELKNNEKICSDLFESLAAAIFLDLGEAALDQFLEKFLFAKIKQTSIEDENLKDPKTRLQELLQPLTKQPVEYKTEYDNLNQKWSVKAVCNGFVYGNGFAKTKNEAIISAANDALEKYQKINQNNK